MSSTLQWEPAERAKKDLPDALKFTLRRRCDGNPVNRNFDNSDYWYLKGLVDAQVEGAEELLDAIQKYGAVHVTEEW